MALYMVKRRQCVFTVGRVRVKNRFVPQVWYAAHSLDGELVWLGRRRKGLHMTKERATGVVALGTVSMDIKCRGRTVQSIKLGRLLDAPRNARRVAEEMVDSLTLECGAALSTDAVIERNTFIETQLCPLWNSTRRTISQKKQ